MTRHVLNLHTPVKSLTQQVKEQIDAAIAAIPTSSLPFIYITQANYLANNSIISQSIASLTSGGTILLGPGTFYNNPASPTTPLSIPANVTIIGSGQGTIFKSPILIVQGGSALRDFAVVPAGATYGIKLFQSGGGGTTRVELHRMFVGALNATDRDAALGPAKGLWLDGSILAEVNQCTFAFCTASGLYIDTSNGAWSTNVNTFRTCTFNFNLRYGVEITQGSDGVAGIMLPRFDGGNMEGNLLGEFYADQTTSIEIRGVDFESHESFSNVIDISACNPVLIESCNFVKSVSASIDHLFLITNCVAPVVKSCRESGTGWAGAIGIFTEGTYGGKCDDFRFSSAGCYILNRGYR